MLRVDGGMVASDWTMQRLADILAAPVDRPVVLETTVLGAAWLAGSRAGLWPDQKGFAATWKRDRRFEPGMDAGERDAAIAGWQDSVSLPDDALSAQSISETSVSSRSASLGSLS